MRHFFYTPKTFLVGVVIIALGALARAIIYLIDRRTEPAIMRRHINDGSEVFFAREELEGDPMVNQATFAPRRRDRDRDEP